MAYHFFFVALVLMAAALQARAQFGDGFGGGGGFGKATPCPAHSCSSGAVALPKVGFRVSSPGCGGMGMNIMSMDSHTRKPGDDQLKVGNAFHQQPSTHVTAAFRTPLHHTIGYAIRCNIAHTSHIPILPIYPPSFFLLFFSFLLQVMLRHPARVLCSVRLVSGKLRGSVRKVHQEGVRVLA